MKTCTGALLLFAVLLGAAATGETASPPPFTFRAIDSSIVRAQKKEQRKPARLTTDDQFLRRVTLDLTGKLPTSAEVEAFLVDANPRKRSERIDQLLASDAYARYWAGYWRDVLSARLSDRRGRALVQPFEDWLAEQFRHNQGWDQIVRALLTAEGAVRFDEPAGKNGAAFFLVSHTGPDAVNQWPAETARIFLGIQIQCAQCHDHPFADWKQQQFHELAGYFARLRTRTLREQSKTVGLELYTLSQGEHRLPSKQDPSNGAVTHPRYLDGQAPARQLSDRERRRALADAIVGKNNDWFAAAFVNRVWGELLGQAFYQPVDDRDAAQDVVFPDVLRQLANSFRESHYDIRALLRAILNSNTYQRQVRLGESLGYHLYFTASYPKRLRAEALWQSLVNALGPLESAREPGGRPDPFLGVSARLRGLELVCKKQFDFDPSQRPEDLSGSIPQALFLMNHPLLNERIETRGDNLLARLLKEHPRDDEALPALYVHTLARRPTRRELDRFHSYIRRLGNRTEAFEDILWTLINSTEFQTKR